MTWLMNLDQQRPTVSRFAMRVGVVLGLLYLIGPLSDLVHASMPAARLAGISVGLAAFVAVYWMLLPPPRWLVRRPPGWTIAALALLPLLAGALLLAGAPSSFVALFIYCLAPAGLLLPAWPAIAVILVTAAAVGIGTEAAGENSSSVTTWVLTIVSVGAIMAAFGRITRVNTELRAAREQLARLAVSEERLRIARDLHDLLGHSLSVIALKTELAAKLVRDDSERAASELDDIGAVTRRALAEVRGAVQGYRRLALDEALDGARIALSAAGIDYHLEEAQRGPLPAEVEAVLAWAVREGTTNVVRHSHADRCDIRVRADGELAAVEVEDNGDAAASPGRAGSGLSGLAERARAVRGTLEAGPRRGGGFRLCLTVPLGEA